MKKATNKIVMPASYTPVCQEEMENLTGGVSLSSILDFFSYILGGLDISFGRQQNNVNTQTTATASQASTGVSTASGYSGSSVSAVATRTEVTTGTQGSYFDWDANFNLGDLFERVVSLFL